MKALKTIFLFAILSSLMVSCTQKMHPTSSKAGTVTDQYVQRDGSSYEKAIIITKKSETEGVAAEYEWLKSHYTGYKMGDQSLTNYKGKPYDILNITTTNGKKKEVYFDISNFFGKF